MVRGNRPNGRHASGDAELITILWRDIPTQVTARAGRRKVSMQLADRFQVAADRAAVVAGKHTTDDYLAEWRRDARPCGDDLEAEAEAAAKALEARFTADVLQRLVEAGGVLGGAAP